MTSFNIKQLNTLDEFKYNTQFPVNKKNNYAIIIVNSDNIDCLINNAAYNLPQFLTDKLLFNEVFLFVDGLESMAKIQLKVQNLKNLKSIYCLSSIELITRLASTFISLNDCNILLVINSFGYCSKTNDNYIIFKREVIKEQLLYDTIINSLNIDSACLILADACQSGTILNFNYKTYDFKSYERQIKTDSTKNIACISDILDINMQSQEHNITDNNKYGGQLISAFIDYYSNNIDQVPTIGGFYNFYLNKIHNLSTYCALSFNNLTFLADLAVSPITKL